MNKPGWLKDAVATAQGFVSPKGEMLKRQRLTQEFIDEWNGKPAPKKVEAPAAEEAPKKTTKKKTAKKSGSKVSALKAAAEKVKSIGK